MLLEAVAVEVLAQTMVRARFVGYWFDQLGQGGQAGVGQQAQGGYGNLILSRLFREFRVGIFLQVIGDELRQSIGHLSFRWGRQCFFDSLQ